MQLSFKTLVVTAVAVIALFNAASIQVFAQDEVIIKGKKMLQLGENRNDAKALTEAQAYFEGLMNAQSTAPQKALTHYYAGYAGYRLANTTTNDDQRDAYLDNAMQHLETCVELDKNFADGFALLSGIYGRKSTGMISAMKYGPKASTAGETALKLDPKNPRALILGATSLFFRPAMWGGDKKKAVEQWQRAAQILDDAPTKETAQPTWGHEEAYAWLGQAFADEGNADAARAAYDRALEINPDYGWVKNVLYPKLAKK